MPALAEQQTAATQELPDVTFAKESENHLFSKGFIQHIEKEVEQENIENKSVNELLNNTWKSPVKKTFVFQPRSEFITWQKWEGVVMEILSETYIARIYDLDGDRDEEEVELYKSELSNDDSELLKEGAIFYWSIGYEESPSKQRRKSSVIKFRRMPAWRRKDISKFQENAQKLTHAIGWKPISSPS